VRDRTALVLLAVVVVLAGVAWHVGGPRLAAAGLVHGGEVLVSVAPLLLAAFLIAGLVQALISREWVGQWLGSASGWRGIGLACLAGALMPGGPYVYYPICAALLQAGAGVGVLVAFITAKNLWSVTRIPLEFALLGPHLALIRYAVTLILPPLFGAVAEMLFGARLERIRRAAAP